MSNEPTYPADAVPGVVSPPALPLAEAEASDTPANDDENASVGEAVQAAKAALGTVNWQRVGVGAAIGIGSAAVAAALLYANHTRRD